MLSYFPLTNLKHSDKNQITFLGVSSKLFSHSLWVVSEFSHTKDGEKRLTHNSWKFVLFSKNWVFWCFLASFLAVHSFCSLFLVFSWSYASLLVVFKKKNHISKTTKRLWKDYQKTMNCQESTKKPIFAKRVQTFSYQAFLLFPHPTIDRFCCGGGNWERGRGEYSRSDKNKRWSLAIKQIEYNFQRKERAS